MTATTILSRLREALNPRGGHDRRMFGWILKTSTTAGLGLGLMTLAYLDQATYFVA